MLSMKILVVPYFNVKEVVAIKSVSSIPVSQHLFVLLGGGIVQFHGFVHFPVLLTDQFQGKGPI